MIFLYILYLVLQLCMIRQRWCSTVAPPDRDNGRCIGYSRCIGCLDGARAHDHVVAKRHCDHASGPRDLGWCDSEQAVRDGDVDILDDQRAACRIEELQTRSLTRGIRPTSDENVIVCWSQRTSYLAKFEFIGIQIYTSKVYYWHIKTHKTGHIRRIVYHKYIQGPRPTYKWARMVWERRAPEIMREDLTDMSREVNPVKLVGNTKVCAVIELTLYCAASMHVMDAFLG